MKNQLFLIGLLFLGIAAKAQTASLTIFSEEGHKFYLILNGQKQNDQPETNIRVEGLSQPYYSGKIVFAETGLGELSKPIQLRDGNNAPLDLTFKIKAGKDGKQVMRYFASNPVTSGAPPQRQADVPVYNSGVTTPVSSSTTVTQTTVTQTTGANTNTNVNMGGAGINMSVNIPADAVVKQTTTTTTTTTTSSNTNNNMGVQGQAGYSSSGCNGYPMAPGDFQSAKGTIEQATFEETKLSTAKQIAGANCLYTEQIERICRLFTFENSKLDFAKYAYKRCIDPQNYFKINNVFTFDASKTELSNFIGQ